MGLPNLVKALTILRLSTHIDHNDCSDGAKTFQPVVHWRFVHRRCLRMVVEHPPWCDSYGLQSPNIGVVPASCPRSFVLKTGCGTSQESNFVLIIY
jgi:hypothetical protein